VIGLATVLFTGQAMAFQCPKLVKQIEDEIAIRFDPASQDAKAGCPGGRASRQG